ncbi:MAG: anthranilate phosphoribosyltransferase [Proteobacteria bacterium]|nr:anthranilate phosphoribosyltransferase [Pseudomonadota bacterium]
MSLKPYIEIIKKGHFRSDNQAYEAFQLIADGQIGDIEQIKEFLLAINERGVDVRLLSMAAKVLNERSIKLKAPDNAIDVCGTGGDKLNSLNVSTAVSFVVAAAGVVVAKHGNKAVSSASGSADIFSELGIDINQDKQQVEASLIENNIAFIFAPLYHPALKRVGQARKELGVKTIFNYLGPLLNPAQTNYQLIGCADQKIAQIMLETAASLNKKKCWVVHGLDGMDEISITNNSVIYKMDEEVIYDCELFDQTKYIQNSFTIDDIRGKDPKYNAAKLVELLNGKKDSKQLEAYHDIVLLNAAAALLIANKFDNFTDAFNSAKEVIASKKALNLLKKIAKNV